WRASPSRERLLAMREAAAALDRISEVLAAEADALERGATAASPPLACELLLLDGRVAPALALVEAAPPLGWSGRGHPGPRVVACAESVARRFGAPCGSAFGTEIRGRYPRHSAFRDELDRATRRSPLLPPPPRRK